jgi:hypothetical protein
VWDGPLGEEEFTTLNEFRRGKDWDNSFANAFAQLVAALRPKQGETAFVVTEALVGMEQLKEISDKATPPTKDDPKLTWTGKADEKQVAALKAWGKQSEYEAAFAELLQKLLEKQVEVTFVPDGGKIPTAAELPPELRDRLTPGADRVTWKGLNLSPMEEGKLAELATRAGLSEAFKQAVGKLKPRIDAETVTVAVSNFKPRPSNDPASSDALPASLRPKLIVANGVIGFDGWMTRDEARRLFDSQAERPVNRRAIVRLFDDSVSRGLGGVLGVTARRGSAAMKGGKVEGKLVVK